MFITKRPIDLAEFLAQKPGQTCGAVASFVGAVRNHDHGKPVSRLYYECYPSMAEKQIQSIVDEAKGRWAVEEVRVTHRIGWLEVGEAAVAIAVSSAHREEAFAACRHVIERIKTNVPIWKKELFEDGTSDWVLCGHRHEEVFT